MMAPQIGSLLYTYKNEQQNYFRSNLLCLTPNEDVVTNKLIVSIRAVLAQKNC